MKASSFLATAIEAADAAADIILHYYERNIDVEIKQDQTPVTVADVEAEKEIREVILTQFPDHGLLCEESGRHESDSPYLWLVDPIDGTKSFIRSYPFFSTQIALMEGDQIIAGVSNAPVFRQRACAELGKGAWLNENPCQVSDRTEIGEVALSTGNIRSLARSKRWPALGRLMASADRSRGYGDFYHYHLLAAGRIDAVIESDVDILDVAALSLIVREAGGIFTDLDGNEVNLDTQSALAANAALHKKLLHALGS